MSSVVDFEFYRLSPYAKSLVPEERQLYIEKLAVLNSDDPYLFPVESWKNTGLPEINENDVFQYLISKHSALVPGLQMSAYKAIRCDWWLGEGRILHQAFKWYNHCDN